MYKVRWHGRGGQGVVTAARLLGRAAAIYGGRYAQSFPHFGTERRGAPVTAFTRISSTPIRDRSQVYEPNCVVVLDETLLEGVDVLQGLLPEGFFILNAARTYPDLTGRLPEGTAFYQLELTSLARDVLGVPIVNTAMVGALAAITGWVSLEAVEKAIEDIFPAHLVEKNLRLAGEAFKQGLAVKRDRVALARDSKSFSSHGDTAWRHPEESSGGKDALGSFGFGPHAPTPLLLAKTGSWRIMRPVVNKDRCNGCLVCWLFCPDGCVRRGGGGIEIDLDFCKGCGICARECPRGALEMINEASLVKEEGKVAGVS